MCGGATVLLVLFGTGVSTGGVSLPQVAADARLAVLGPRDGRPEAGRAALERIVELEAETADRWADRPNGPQLHLAALALAHAAAAEAVLDGLVPADALRDLERNRRACHAPVPSDAPLFAVDAFLADLREHRPEIYEAFEKAPGTRAAFVAALSRPGRAVWFDPREPEASVGQCLPRGAATAIRISARPHPAFDQPYFSTALFESFNTHNAPLLREMARDAAAGRVDRDDYITIVLAAEQITAANLLGVLRRHFAELDAAGLADDPRAWQVGNFPLFVPAPPTWRVRVRGFPHGIYGRFYDLGRLIELVRTGADYWEAAALSDRIAMREGELVTDDVPTRRARAALAAAGRGDPWLRLYYLLPGRARAWLSTVRGGESVAKVCRAVWRGRGGAFAAWF